MKLRTVVLVIIGIAGLLFSSARGVAQTVQIVDDAKLPRFAVVSIKPSADNFPGMRIEPRADGSYAARKTTLGALIGTAFDITVDRIFNAPSWWNRDRFDIDARYERGDVSGPVPSSPLLLRSLLGDRFHLIAHVERRDLPVFKLRVVRRDRLGPRLQQSTIDCAGMERPANGTPETTTRNGAPPCGATENPEAFIASGVSMDVLARALRPATGRPVINDTGLPGRWDITLQFSPAGAPPTDRDKPEVFTAVREQLGLKLESARAPVDVLVIDHVEHPDPD